MIKYGKDITKQVLCYSMCEYETRREKEFKSYKIYTYNL